MTPELYREMVISATIGILLQLVWKAIRLAKKAGETNEPFNLLIWLKADKWVLILNILSPYIVVYLFDEWAFTDADTEGPWVKWIKTMFVFIGFTGSTVLMGLLSVIDKRLSKIIDTKTNLQDFGTEQKPK